MLSQLLGFFPAINQIEYHPYWQAREVVSFCNKNGILVEVCASVSFALLVRVPHACVHFLDRLTRPWVTAPAPTCCLTLAWSPSPPLTTCPLARYTLVYCGRPCACLCRHMLDLYTVSSGLQLVLQYNLQSGADIVIPRSHNPAHQEENLNLFNPVRVALPCHITTYSILTRAICLLAAVFPVGGGDRHCWLTEAVQEGVQDGLPALVLTHWCFVPASPPSMWFARA